MADMSIFEQAVGQAWEQIKLEHPEQAQSIEDNFGDGDIVLAINQQLANDAAYAALVAETNVEVSIANMIPLVMPFVINVVGILVSGGLGGL
jgi:hypothetical protein